MKQLLSTFGSELFEPLVTKFIPGAVAIGSWCAFFTHFTPFSHFVHEHRVEAAVTLCLAAVAAGLVVEDLGSLIESRVFDKSLKREEGFRFHEGDWKEYLRLKFDVEPIGHKYLRSIVLRLKFELGTGIALVSSSVGLLFTHVSCRILVVAGTLHLVLATYLFFEARQSHRLLSSTRHELLKANTRLVQL